MNSEEHFEVSTKTFDRKNRDAFIGNYLTNLFRTIPTPAAAPDAKKITRPGPVGVLAGVGMVGGTYVVRGGMMLAMGGGAAGFSRVQTAVQPSLFRLLPSSHCSITESRMESPQRCGTQLGRHSALGMRELPLPASHSSNCGCRMPSPHSGSGVHEQKLSQSSLLVRLPSSHCSPSAVCTTPSPQ